MSADRSPAPTTAMQHDRDRSAPRDEAEGTLEVVQPTHPAREAIEQTGPITPADHEPHLVTCNRATCGRHHHGPQRKAAGMRDHAADDDRGLAGDEKSKKRGG